MTSRHLTVRGVGTSTVVGILLSLPLVLGSTCEAPKRILITPDIQFYPACDDNPDPPNTALNHPWCRVISMMVQYANDWDADLFINVGDVVHRPANSFGLYEQRVEEFSALEMPYVIVPGNHDMSGNLEVPGQYLYYDDYFGEAFWMTKPWVFDWFPPTSDPVASYRAEGVNVAMEGPGFNVLGLEFWFGQSGGTVRDSLAWADSVLAANPGRTMLVTHSLVEAWFNPSTWTQQGAYSAPWVLSRCNIRYVISGHTSGRRSEVVTNDCGEKVLLMLVNYQTETSLGLNDLGEWCWGWPEAPCDLEHGYRNCVLWHSTGSPGCGDGWVRELQILGDDAWWRTVNVVTGEVRTPPANPVAAFAEEGDIGLGEQP